jgi:hypothetical protein
MQSQPSPHLPLNPQVPLVVRACGRTLIIAFLVLVIVAVLPFQPRSLAWASQISSRIIDTASFALLGVALLRLASFLLPEPDPLSEPRQAMALARQRDGALRLCRLGAISLGLLAIWQIPLLLGSITSLEQQNLARSNQLKQQLSQGEQTIREAPPAVIQREWQRLSAAGAPGISQEIRDPEQQRQLLLEQLEQQQQQLGRTISNQDGQGRFALVRNILRNLALCAVYIGGFLAIGRRRPSTLPIS